MFAQAKSARKKSLLFDITSKSVLLPIPHAV